MSQCVSAKQHHSIQSGLQSTRKILKGSNFGFSISPQTQKRMEIIELVPTRRENLSQNLGFASRPFVLCGLPVKRPPKGTLLHERRNGQFLLQVIGHPQYGVPWGQDRLVPIFLATLAVRQQSQRITFRSAAEMLDLFGMQQGGSQIPASYCGISTGFRRHNILRNRHATGEGDRDASWPIQLYARGSDLVFAKSRTGDAARRL